MTPDWYVDPLGRYEGRYFDGEQWTAQVKDRGRLVVDPDWDRPDVDETVDEDVADAVGADAVGADVVEAATPAEPGFAEPVRAAVEPIAPAPVLDPAPALDPIDETAVAAGAVDFSQESPARQVAVLDSPEPETVSDTIVTDEDSSGSRRWLYVLGLAILALALLVILLPRLLGNDETADSGDEPAAAVGTDDTADDVDGADEGALPATEVDEATDNDARTDADEETPAEDAADSAEATDDAASTDEAMADDEGGERVIDPGSDALLVGSLEILNAKPVLRDLAVWHESSLTGRDITLGDDADCWLGSIGEAVVQNAHCGPVAATPGAEPRFDLVPLRFEDVSEGVIQIRPITDAVVIDAVLPNGLQLVGRDGPIDPTSFAPDPASNDAPDDAEDTGRGRGERETGDS